MKNPFKIEMTENVTMGAWELMLQIGAFKSKRDAEVAAKELAEYLTGDSGWAKRVQ